ncbi:MAG TPA: DUF2784 domain-containing protein [Spirochaetia bacterium]|nr:DUF2784 domain-containing protein [Spirochaetia bacterium]
MVVVFHFLYVLFAVGGEAIILVGALSRRTFVRNVPFRVSHLVSVVIVMFEAVIGMICPITELEYSLRRLAGQRVEEDITFVGRLIRLLVYYDFPHWVFMVLYAGFGIVVTLTYILLPPQRGKKTLS